MVKDDYDVIVYRVLLYLYACMKRKIVFDDNTFHAAVRKNVESDEYFYSVLRMMQTEGLICGVVTTKAWGGSYILCSNLCDMEITADGIHYLKENGRMQKIWSILKDAADITAELATKVGLYLTEQNRFKHDAEMRRAFFMPTHGSNEEILRESGGTST